MPYIYGRSSGACCTEASFFVAIDLVWGI